MNKWGGERAYLNSIGGYPKQPPKATIRASPCGSQGLDPKVGVWGIQRLPLSTALASQLHHPKKLKLLAIFLP